MKNETEKIRKLYDKWQTQGINKQAFCNQNGIGYHKFNYWVKKFRPQDPAVTAPILGFSQIPVQQSVAMAQEQPVLAAVTFPSGARLELFGSMDVSFIRALVL